MEKDKTKEVLLKTGRFLYEFINGRLYGDSYSIRLLELMERAAAINPFFTLNEITKALRGMAFCLTETEIDTWLANYDEGLFKEKTPKNIGVIMAGNIPMVGWHDMICVLMSGNRFIGKPSSEDAGLTQFFADLLMEIEPELKDRIVFTERLNEVDAVIATGSNNSARFFNYYFGKKPNIIRKNRNSVAIINGDETFDDFNELGKDIFDYFGLGCRNVSKMYVPQGYDFNLFFESIQGYSKIIDHHRYANNYDYNRSILLMKLLPFLDNGFLLVREDTILSSPISVLFYERFENMEHLNELIKNQRENIQCMASKDGYFPGNVAFGMTQFPHLWDYADGVDTLNFLLTLSTE